MTTEINNLETEKLLIENELSNGTLDHDELLIKSQRHGDILKILDIKEMRWLVLSEKGS